MSGSSSNFCNVSNNGDANNTNATNPNLGVPIDRRIGIREINRTDRFLKPIFLNKEVNNPEISLISQKQLSCTWVDVLVHE